MLVSFAGDERITAHMNPQDISSRPREHYSAPKTIVVELSADTPILQFSTKDWGHDPDELR